MRCIGREVELEFESFRECGLESDDKDEDEGIHDGAQEGLRGW